MVIVGIDTDSKGSVAIIDTRKQTLDIYPIPNRPKLLKGGQKRTEVNFPALAALMTALISSVPADQEIRFYLEEQWGQKGDGPVGAFSFGKTFGDCRSAVIAALLTRIPLQSVEKHIVFIPASEWKSAMKLSSDKSLSLKLASSLFPDCKHAWKLTSKYTSAAEAALIAFYGVSLNKIKVNRIGKDTRGYIVNSPVDSLVHPPLKVLTRKRRT
jgi:hypothetical protein